MVQFTTAKTADDIQQILDLQARNLPRNISKQEAREQGFVTVHHDYAILSAMNEQFPHIIAKDKQQVIGYTLVMLQEFSKEIPILVPMFKKINGLLYQEKLLKNTSYFIMGQVCVDKKYRGQHIFSGLYQQMKKEMSPHFKYILTEIATRNTRSIRAHEKVGFETIHTYNDGQEEWAIVIWNWR